MKIEYLFGFDKMVTPIIIRVLYFLGLIGIVVGAGISLFQGRFLFAIGLLVFGALGVRVYCELLMLLFRIHDNLAEINQRQKNTAQP
jgi:hypothetical protein